MITPAEPVRHTEAHTVTSTPAGGPAMLRALRTVLLFTLTDSFALVPEETMWAGYHFESILAPLEAREALLVPLAVRQEMMPPHPYSSALDDAEAKGTAIGVGEFDPRVTHADVTDWAAVFMQTISGCYALRPLEEATMRGQIIGVLTELGVGHPDNPRPSRYLPNDVRHRLNSN